METCTRDDAAVAKYIEAAIDRAADRLMARLEARYGLTADPDPTPETEAQASERELLGGNR